LTELSIFNTLGQRVHIESLGRLSEGRHAEALNLSNFASGLYIVELSTSTALSRAKILLLK
jgi:hypothetical protein